VVQALVAGESAEELMQGLLDSGESEDLYRHLTAIVLPVETVLKR
jgi:hypothetical protein